jgi:hypothetical protein
VLRMSGDVDVEEKEVDGVRSLVTPDEEESTTGEQSSPEFGQKGFFMPNENMRFGTSRDQDGECFLNKSCNHDVLLARAAVKRQCEMAKNCFRVAVVVIVRD